jgi:hypothetical protein
MNFMMKGQGLSREELFKKFLCYGDDGMNVFQGEKTKVTTNQGFLATILDGCSLCCSSHKFDNLTLGGFDFHC